jgi:ribosome recycling factor
LTSSFSWNNISNNNKNLQRQQHQQYQHFQQLRWKHGSAKFGKTRETLDEIAHRPEREAAQVKRQKNKEKQVAKKSKKVKEGSDTVSAVTRDDKEDHDDDDTDDDDDDGEDGEDGEDAEDAAATSLPVPSEIKIKMMGFVLKFQESLKSMQGTDPTPELFEDIQVDAYGEMTTIKAVGQVVIVSPTLAQINCFDPSVTKNVLKAIQLALQLNPQQSTSEGSEGVILIPLPRVSLETRQETAKLVQKRAESCRQKIRTIRRKQMAIIKQGKDGKIPGISEDDAFVSSKDLEKVTQDVLKVIQDSVDVKLETILLTVSSKK